MLYKLVTEGRSLFEDNDIKQLQDSVVIIYIICLPLLSVSWKFDIFIVTPIALISQLYATNYIF